MKKLIYFSMLLMAIGCSKGGSADRLMHGSEAPKILACCQNNNLDVLTYPASVPQSHVDACKTVKDGDIAMHVGCGQGHGYQGDEFYPAGY